MPNKSTVLIISSPSDIHAFAVAKTLKNDFRCHSMILDLSRYPTAGIMTNHVNQESFTGRFIDGETTHLEDVVSVWWRRPQPIMPNAEICDPRLKNFVVQECRSTFEGMLYSAGCRFVNDRFCKMRANNKLYQLNTARQCGFRIPETVLSNDPQEVLRFVEEKKFKVIFKPQTDAKYHLGETRLVTEESLAKINLVSLSPVIFQEFIPAAYDIRLTVVGKEQFAVKIDSQKGYPKIDWRLDLMTPMETMPVPESLFNKAEILMRRLGLDYGAIDLRVTPEGEIVFFEVNPTGQFLFCELDKTLKITRAVCRLLTESLESANL